MINTVAATSHRNTDIWHSEGVQGWQGFIKVDGKTYNWMGNHPSTDFADQTAQSYTSTKTKFVMNVGAKVELTVSFLSPVFPDDHIRQSIPFAYMNVEVKSIDGRSHSVQIYSDVSGGKYTRTGSVDIG